MRHMATNASLLKADQNTTIAQLDYKKINARNYPYLKLNTGYGYTLNKYDIAANSQRGNLGFNGGLTVGFQYIRWQSSPGKKKCKYCH